MLRSVSPPRVGALVRRAPSGALFALMACLSAAPAAAQRAELPPTPTLLRGVQLEPDGEAVSVFLDGGRIVRVGSADAALPAGAREVNGEGLLCLPAFHDAFTQTGLSTPEPQAERDEPLDVRGDVRIDMRVANRKGIQPAFRGADSSELPGKDLERFRKNGFGIALQAPTGEILGGKSVLIALRNGPLRERIVRPEVHSHADFNASGRGYPSTLMGYFSQLRQFFADSERHGQLKQRFEAGFPGPRPPFDPELDAGLELLAGRELWCEAQSRRDVRRWLRLGDEYGLSLSFVGARESGDLAEMLGQRGANVVLTLNWGEEPEDPQASKEADEEELEDPEGEGSEGAESDEAAESGTAEEEAEEDLSAWVYSEPAGVLLERRTRWERRRDAAQALHAAGVPFAFGSADQKPGEMLDKVREVVEAGLSRDVALAGLTTQPASFAGLEQRLGQVAAGYNASLALWDGDPLTDEDAEVRWLFVDGYSWDAESAIDETEDEKDEDRNREER